jgi:serine/threonine-protein kinase HipA
LKQNDAAGDARREVGDTSDIHSPRNRPPRAKKVATLTPARASAGERNAVQTLDVRMRPTLVGALTHLGNEALISAFDRAYIDAGSDRPTVSVGFKTVDGNLSERTRPTRVRFPAFFSNLLPEAHLRQYLAAGGGLHRDREFFLIWLLGSDLPGAVEIRSPDTDAPPAAEDAFRHARQR